MDVDVKKAKWRIILKKDRSKRYSTDCLSSVFDGYKPNTMHIDDFKEIQDLRILEKNILFDLQRIFTVYEKITLCL